MTSITDRLRSVLAVRLAPVEYEWLDSMVTAAGTGQIALAGWTTAPSHVVRAPLAPNEDERRDLASVAPHVAFEGWTVIDAARALVLLALAGATAEETFAATATDMYEQGDAGEQQSWLKSLPLLPRPERFLSQAIDACRTNIVPLFASIACDNAYPARYFPTPQFNQLVLKAAFIGLPLTRIVGLDQRRNQELARMAADFADERRAAGRPVPADLHLVLSGPSPAESPQ